MAAFSSQLLLDLGSDGPERAPASQAKRDQVISALMEASAPAADQPAVSSDLLGLNLSPPTQLQASSNDNAPMNQSSAQLSSDLGASGDGTGNPFAPGVLYDHEQSGSNPNLANQQKAHTFNIQVEAKSCLFILRLFSDSMLLDFLEKMRLPAAYNIVQEIKNLITLCTDKNFSVNELAHTVRTFLDRLSDSLPNHELWKTASDQELDNACEGLEKYLLNKLFAMCFQPFGSDDKFRDQAITEKMLLMSFLELQHFEIPAQYNVPSLLESAMRQLRKMDSYKAPRDKIVCILNACKIINGLLQQHGSKGSTYGADEFFPLLTYVTLHSNPPHLFSNLLFIQRFRNPAKLNGEAGFYFTQLMAAVEFIQKMDASKLAIDQQTFDALLNKTLSAAPSASSSPLPGTASDQPLGSNLSSSALLSQPLSSSQQPFDDSTSLYSVAATNPNDLSSGDRDAAPSRDSQRPISQLSSSAPLLYSSTSPSRPPPPAVPYNHSTAPHPGALINHPSSSLSSSSPSMGHQYTMPPPPPAGAPKPLTGHLALLQQNQLPLTPPSSSSPSLLPMAHSPQQQQQQHQYRPPPPYAASNDSSSPSLTRHAVQQRAPAPTAPELSSPFDDLWVQTFGKAK